MSDAMLTELYMRVFQTKREAEALAMERDGTGVADRHRQVALAKNELLRELIDVRTRQLVHGEGADDAK